MNNTVLKLIIVAVMTGAVVSCISEQPEAPPQDPQDLVDVREYVLKATNSYREKRDISPLKSNEILRKAAQDYAEYLIARPGQYNSWNHRTDGRSPTERVRAEGYKGCGGENLYFGFTSREKLPTIGPKAMKGWIDSSGHEANLRRVRFDDIGIGVATRRWRGLWYFVVVQNFGDDTPAERCGSPSGFCFFCW